METTLCNRALRVTLRFGLGGLALLLWHSPSAKAQDCCPGEYTATELARVEASTIKRVKLTAKNEKQPKAALAARIDRVAPGTKASTEKKSKRGATLVTFTQPVKLEEQQ